MKLMYYISLAMTIGGIVFLAIFAYEDTATAWIPVTQPYPGTGYKISYPFDIILPTKYDLELQVPEHPSGQVSEPDKPSLDCTLHVKITSESGIVAEDTVKQFRHVGSMPWAYSDIYDSDKEWDLKRGTYTIEVSSEATPELIVTHGALLNLHNGDNPEAAAVLNVLKAVAIWLLCILGILGLVIDAIQRARKRS